MPIVNMVSLLPNDSGELDPDDVVSAIHKMWSKNKFSRTGFAALTALAFMVPEGDSAAIRDFVTRCGAVASKPRAATHDSSRDAAPRTHKLDVGDD